MIGLVANLVSLSAAGCPPLEEGVVTPEGLAELVDASEAAGTDTVVLVPRFQLGAARLAVGRETSIGALPVPWGRLDDDLSVVADPDSCTVLARRTYDRWELRVVEGSVGRTARSEPEVAPLPPAEPPPRALAVDAALAGPSATLRVPLERRNPRGPVDHEAVWLSFGYQLDVFGVPDMMSAAPSLSPLYRPGSPPFATVRAAVGTAGRVRWGDRVWLRLGLGVNVPQVVDGIRVMFDPTPCGPNAFECVPSGVYAFVEWISALETDLRVVLPTAGPVQVALGSSPRLHLVWNTYGPRSTLEGALLLLNPAASAELTW